MEPAADRAVSDRGDGTPLASRALVASGRAKTGGHVLARGPHPPLRTLHGDGAEDIAWDSEGHGVWVEGRVDPVPVGRRWLWS